MAADLFRTVHHFSMRSCGWWTAAAGGGGGVVGSAPARRQIYLELGGSGSILGGGADYLESRARSGNIDRDAAAHCCAQFCDPLTRPSLHPSSQSIRTRGRDHHEILDMLKTFNMDPVRHEGGHAAADGEVRHRRGWRGLDSPCRVRQAEECRQRPPANASQQAQCARVKAIARKIAAPGSSVKIRPLETARKPATARREDARRRRSPAKLRVGPQQILGERRSSGPTASPPPLAERRATWLRLRPQ